MTWLLSLLGIGGITAALVFIPGLAANALSALSALLTLIRRNPWPSAVIALCALLAWTWHGKSKAIATRDAALTELAHVIDTQKQAEAAQLAVNRAAERRYKEIADEADREHQAELADARSRSARYAERNRVSALCRGSSGAAPAPADDHGPESPDGARADAVVVSRDDFDIMVENSVRLKAAHDWALTLVKPELPDVAVSLDPAINKPR